MTTPELKKRLQKSLDFLKSELSQIRTGRVTPSLVEDIIVDAYGAEMKVKELGSIVVMDPQNLVVTPWDKNLIKEIEGAIRESELNLSPVVEADRIRVAAPALTEERREEFAKLVSEKVEECKNSIRNIRKDAMKDIENAFNDSEISEDEKYTQKDEVDDICKDIVEQAEELGTSKKEDLMTV
jgi:ribosome recycling factor